MADKMDLFKHSNVGKWDSSAMQLNERLPVKLAAADVEENPEFEKLLLSISQLIKSDGTSVLPSEEVANAKKHLTQRKQKWLQNSVLYGELQELLLDQQLEAAHCSQAPSQFYTAVGEMLTGSELGDYLNFSNDPNCAQTLLGINSEDLNRNNPHKKSVQQKLIPELEQRLRKRCETLVNFHNPSTEIGAGDSAQFAFAKSCHLASLLQEEKKSLEEEKQQLVRDKTKRLYQFSQYQKALGDSLQLMDQLLSKYRIKVQPESDRATSECLIARCDALSLKIRVLELQLKYDTYYPDAVRALNTIRMELNLSINEAEQDLSGVARALETYESVGLGFDSVVDEFTRLRDEIENKKWALHELKKHQIVADLQS